MLARTKSMVLMSALAAVLVFGIPASSSSRAATGGSAQPLPAWVVPAAVAAAVVTVASVATTEDPLLQTPRY
ncbi:MAG TPA: hypothetical protein VFU38_01060 [Candidatus Krumholzibacteria bacterium]|nr:hypothetical protein [Candidatus Krumholzibacteria bacterium]